MMSPASHTQPDPELLHNILTYRQGFRFGGHLCETETKDQTHNNSYNCSACVVFEVVKCYAATQFP